MTKPLPMADHPSNWYEDGLNFKCTECGQCCTGQPGYVFVEEREIINMAQFLKLSLDEFTRRYVRIVNGRVSLLENSRNYDCVFLKDNKCQIYSVRPTQCRTFPWWPQNLESPQAWQRAAKFCEGINLNAPKVSSEIIHQQLSIQKESKA